MLFDVIDHRLRVLGTVILKLARVDVFGVDGVVVGLAARFEHSTC